MSLSRTALRRRRCGPAMAERKISAHGSSIGLRAQLTIGKPRDIEQPRRIAEAYHRSQPHLAQHVAERTKSGLAYLADSRNDDRMARKLYANDPCVDRKDGTRSTPRRSTGCRVPWRFGATTARSNAYALDCAAISRSYPHQRRQKHEVNILDQDAQSGASHRGSRLLIRTVFASTSGSCHARKANLKASVATHIR